MKKWHYIVIGIILLLIGSSLGGAGTPDDQQIRGLGGVFSIVGIGLIVYAVTKKKKTD